MRLTGPETSNTKKAESKKLTDFNRLRVVCITLRTLILTTFQVQTNAYNTTLINRHPTFSENITALRSWKTSIFQMPFTYKQRLRTFTSWPHSSPSASAMAAAGFIRFYHHANDCVKCLDCGLCLDSWKPDDLPLDEHAGRKPKCPFVMALTAAEAPSNAALKNSSGAETAQMSKAILQLDEQQHSTSASTAQSIMSPTLQLQKDLAAEGLKVLKAKIQKLKERQTRVGNQLVAEKEAHRKVHLSPLVTLQVSSNRYRPLMTGRKK